jgi:hypothetical protein
MMFGILVNNIDLNSGSRLFDVTLDQEIYTAGFVLQSTTSITLEPCTDQHFNFQSGLSNLNSKFPVTTGICPTIGQEFNIQGRFTSDLFSQLKLKLIRCDPVTDRTCAPDATLTSELARVGGIFQLLIPIVTLNINPGS